MKFHESSAGLLYPGGQPDNYSGGCIQRVNLDTGKFETIYDECNGLLLRGPNDIVFDEQGGFLLGSPEQPRATSNEPIRAC